MSFKLPIVQEVERGKLPLLKLESSMVFKVLLQFWVGYENMVTLIGKIKHRPICQNPRSKKIIELEAKVKLLKKRKTFLEQQVFVADKKPLSLI